MFVMIAPCFLQYEWHILGIGWFLWSLLAHSSRQLMPGAQWQFNLCIVKLLPVSTLQELINIMVIIELLSVSVLFLVIVMFTQPSKFLHSDGATTILMNIDFTGWHREITSLDLIWSMTSALKGALDICFSSIFRWVNRCVKQTACQMFWGRVRSRW